MNILLILFSIVSLAHCLKRFKELRDLAIEQGGLKDYDVTGESLLFFLSIISLIKVIFY